MWAESSSGFDMSLSLPCPRRRRLWIIQVSVHIPSESAGGSFTSYSYSPLMFDRKSVVNLSLQVSTTIWATSCTVCVCVMSSKNTMWAGRRWSSFKCCHIRDLCDSRFNHCVCVFRVHSDCSKATVIMFSEVTVITCPEITVTMCTANSWWVI